MTLLVVCYDIPDNRRRNKVARLLEGFGERVQKSIFECDLDARRQTRLRHLLSAMILPSEDKLRFYTLCGKDRALSLAWDKAGVRRPRTSWLL